MAQKMTTAALKELKWRYLRQTLKEIVEYHNAIMNLAKDFEDVFTVSQLLEYLGISVVFCAAAYSCTVFPLFSVRSLTVFTLLGGNLYVLYVLNYWGDYVTQEGAAVVQACYDTSFVGEDVRFQRALQSIMHISQVKVQFTAGKFVPMSLDTFKRVMKTSYSYVMVLRHFANQMEAKIY